MRTGLFFILTVCSLHAIATELAPLQAFRRLRQENLSFTGTSRMTNAPRLIKTFEEEGIKTLYALNDDEHTYIVTAQSEASPLVAVLDHKLESFDSISPIARAIFENASKQVVNQLHEAKKATINYEAWPWSDPEWTKYPKIDPLLRTDWGQKHPYNQSLVYQNGTDTVTFPPGCAATALAQLIKYHEYINLTTDPTKQICSAKFRFHTGTEITKQINISDPEYAFSPSYAWRDWHKMPLKYQGAFDKDFKDVSNLMVLCGYAMGSFYTPLGTAIIPLTEKNTLIEYFGYDNNIQILYPIDFTQDKLTEIYYNELKNRRPILFSFQMKEVDSELQPAAHDAIIDGYEVKAVTTSKTSYEATFHINMGKGGECSGYYPLNSFIFNCEGDVYKAEGQYAMIGIQPPVLSITPLKNNSALVNPSLSHSIESKETSSLNYPIGTFIKQNRHGDFIIIK